jgi:hypothetical protein
MATEKLTIQQVTFEIGFALGQAGAAHFVALHAESPKARLKALDALAAIVSARFETLTVTRELPIGWDRSQRGPEVTARRRWTD